MERIKDIILSVIMLLVAIWVFGLCILFYEAFPSNQTLIVIAVGILMIIVSIVTLLTSIKVYKEEL